MSQQSEPRPDPRGQAAPGEEGPVRPDRVEVPGSPDAPSDLAGDVARAAWGGARKAAFALGKGVGTARVWARRAAESPAAERVTQGAREAAQAVSDKVAPVARRTAGTALDAADMVLQEIGSKLDEAAQASEVGRRPTSPAAGARRPAQGEPAGQGEAPGTARRPRVDWGPREEVDPRTGVHVVTEAYVIDESGRRDHHVTPDSPALLSPVGRRIAGFLLVLVGIPMLVLPGPGMMAIVAGMAMMRGETPSEGPLSVDPAEAAGVDGAYGDEPSDAPDGPFSSPVASPLGADAATRPAPGHAPGSDGAHEPGPEPEPDPSPKGDHDHAE
ncbi:MAG: PGPGW domain-containing protein [Coriobacteriales bacterium]